MVLHQKPCMPNRKNPTGMPFYPIPADKAISRTPERYEHSIAYQPDRTELFEDTQPVLNEVFGRCRL